MDIIMRVLKLISAVIFGIVVTLRVQSAVAALRGPASTLFTVGGTSQKSTAWVPDQEIRFQVTPRNMNLGR